MKYTDYELSVAVNAAARKAFELGREQSVAMLPPHTALRLSRWDDLPAPVKLQWRQQALPMAQAILEALPDRATGEDWVNGLIEDILGGEKPV